MNKSSINKGAQAGFTLIELIVVIVILGILAATALPKFADLGGDARVAKMQAAVGAVTSASALVHGTWLVAGSPGATATNSTSANSVVLAEGQRIAFINGYPDVGGDGSANTATATATSGIVLAAGLTDYDIIATNNVLTIRPAAGDLASRPNCFITYTEPTVVGAAPTIDASPITAAHCQ